jgi:hypothetical protein
MMQGLAEHTDKVSNRIRYAQSQRTERQKGDHPLKRKNVLKSKKGVTSKEIN